MYSCTENKRILDIVSCETCGFRPNSLVLGVVCNPPPQEMKVGSSGHSQLPSKFKASLAYVRTLSQQNQTLLLQATLFSLNQLSSGRPCFVCSAFVPWMYFVVEPMPLNMVGKYSSSELHSQPSCFQTGSHVAQAGLKLMILLPLPPSVNSTCVCHPNRPFFVFVFKDKVSLCNPSWPAIYYVDQFGFELTKICLPLPPGCWN